VRRYEWQNSDAVGTKAIEQAIETAETKLRQYLGYSPAPHYVVETLQWPRIGRAHGARWALADLQATEGEVARSASRRCWPFRLRRQ
jgi:response regulator of citrate/malate metabolism